MTAKPTFEKAMQQLEDIVAELEKGELPLEKAMKKFEEGISLSRYCNEKLDETERRISLLMEGPDGEAASQPFSAQVSSNGDGETE